MAIQLVCPHCEKNQDCAELLFDSKRNLICYSCSKVIFAASCDEEAIVTTVYSQKPSPTYWNKHELLPVSGD